MTTEAIAKVVADLRSGRILRASDMSTMPPDVAASWIGNPALEDAEVVDATAVFQSLRTQSIDVYDQCIAPPWQNAFICYVNSFDNVLCHLTWVIDDPVADDFWVTTNPINWDDVRWIIRTYVFIGGASNQRGVTIPTCGPLYQMDFAVAADGIPLDLHWRQLHSSWEKEMGDICLSVSLATLNFVNCRNVELVETVPRDRAARRRLARTGVRVSHLSVFPAGRSRRGGGRPTDGSVPLTTVRGHFARYGPEYGRGLLFGKHAGRFFRPQHARGTAEAGEIEHDYTIRGGALGGTTVA